MAARIEGPIDTTPAPSDGVAPRAVPVHVRRLVTVLAWAIAVYVVFRFFPAIKVVLLGVLAAASVACLLKPLADRVPGSRGRSAVVVGLGFVLVVAGVFLGLGYLLAAPLSRELSQLPETRQKLDAQLAHLSRQYEISPPVDSGTLLKQVGGLLGQPGELVAGVGQVVAGAAVALALILIGSMYFLAAPRGELVNPLLPALPRARRGQLTDALDELGPKLRWWLIGVVCSMGIVGVVSGVGYMIAGIKFALPLAVLSALCELVPTIGPIFGGIAAVAVASTQGTSHVAGAVAVWAVVQTLESYVITPLVMKRAVRIPEVVTLFSVIMWGEVFGAPGLFLAIPLNLLVWTAFKHFVVEPSRARAEEAGGDGRAGDGRAGEPVDEEQERWEAAAHPT